MKSTILLDRPAPPIPRRTPAIYAATTSPMRVHRHWGRNSQRLYCSPAHLAKGETYVLERMQDLTRLAGV